MNMRKRDTGSVVMGCPFGFPEEVGTRDENGGPRCEAATGNVVTLGGAREVRQVIDRPTHSSTTCWRCS